MNTIQFESEWDSFDCRVNQINYSGHSIGMVSFMTLKTVPVQCTNKITAGKIRNG